MADRQEVADHRKIAGKNPPTRADMIGWVFLEGG
jgi:hypothetical protein